MSELRSNEDMAADRSALDGPDDEAAHVAAWRLASDVPALLAEVTRLRTERDDIAAWRVEANNEARAMRAERDAARAALASINAFWVAATALAEPSGTPVSDKPASQGRGHRTETYRQTINGRERLGWECLTCLTHEVVMDGPGMGALVPPADIAELDRRAAAHVEQAAKP